MPRRPVLLVLALALCACVPAASAATAADDLAALNGQRAQNGIPAGIVENPDWSAACAQHIAYMAAAGVVTHGEDPTHPAATAAGAWAGANAVLAKSAGTGTSGWTSTASPFEFAPLHLVQLLAPQLASMGIADTGDYACATTWPGATRSAPRVTRVVTYPGHGAGIYAAETTDEWPFTPAERLGLANPTGPHLFAFAWGRDAEADPPHLVRARVDGPTGPVTIRTADTRTPDVGAYLPDGAAIIIPVSPLDAGATYTASVAFSDGSTHAWSFTALADAPAAVRDPATAREPITLRVLPSSPRSAAARRYGVSIAGQADRPGERVRVRIGAAVATYRADAERWFAGTLRVRVPARAQFARVVVHGATTSLAVRRLPLAPATASATA